MRKQFAGLVGWVLLASVAGVGLKAAGAPPNVELLMPFVLSAGLAGGPVAGFLVGLSTRAAYDVYLGWAGWWTLLTAPSYAIAGLFIGYVGLKRKALGRWEMALLAGAATIVYDVVSMLAFGLPFGIPLLNLVVGQIPFSIAHVGGNMLFCFLIAPTLATALRQFISEEKVAVGAPVGV